MQFLNQTKERTISRMQFLNQTKEIENLSWNVNHRQMWRRSLVDQENRFALTKRILIQVDWKWRKFEQLRCVYYTLYRFDIKNPLYYLEPYQGSVLIVWTTSISISICNKLLFVFCRQEICSAPKQILPIGWKCVCGLLAPRNFVSNYQICYQIANLLATSKFDAN